ncbi:MAG: hypothetical protein H0T72_06350, partial [Chloroflexia bacterium]|nr:hypothetical protein [Chloroflexia bacterium]
MSDKPFKTISLDPDYMFIRDIIADPTLGPQLSDPHWTPAIKIYAKSTFSDREPDFSTPRTDVYIT